MTRKQLIGTLSVGTIIAGVIFIGRDTSQPTIKCLEGARLAEAYQTQWSWSDSRSRRRTRSYAVSLPFRELVGQLRSELLTQGWVESDIAPGGAIDKNFQNPARGWTVVIQQRCYRSVLPTTDHEWIKDGSCSQVYVQTEQGSSTLIDRIRSFTEGFDPGFSTVPRGPKSVERGCPETVEGTGIGDAPATLAAAHSA